jgi:DNA-binding transcriptional MerR regulator
MKKATPGPAEPYYRIGAIARLAGIPVATLRVWERRYGVVGPRQGAGGHRLYSREDAGRLALIKQLVDLGNPISSIARLSLDALREMRATADAAARGVLADSRRAQRPLRVAVVGETLGIQIERERSRLTPLDVVAIGCDLDLIRIKCYFMEIKSLSLNLSNPL